MVCKGEQVSRKGNIEKENKWDEELRRKEGRSGGTGKERIEK